jgi:diaminopimelate decarboxylase
MICNNLTVNKEGHLCLGGQDTTELAKKYGTPLYLMDEDLIRARVREYRDAMRDFFPEGSLPEFASKAFSCRKIYEIMAEEEIDIDVVSSGEIYTAVSAGFPMERCFFHGNNKTDFDIQYGIDNGVGYFVVDNMTELDVIDEIAGEKGIIQPVILRLTPGIDPHTHSAITTGQVDSKFGIAIETGQAD